MYLIRGCAMMLEIAGSICGIYMELTPPNPTPFFFCGHPLRNEANAAASPFPDSLVYRDQR